MFTRKKPNFPLKEKISYYYKKKQFFKQKNASFQMCFEYDRAIFCASKT